MALHGEAYLDSREKQRFEQTASHLMAGLCLPARVAVNEITKRYLDEGATYFAQSRIGAAGVGTVTILKSRTLPMDSNNDVARPELYGTIDPRAGAIGNFLRWHRLDELPQLHLARRGRFPLVSTERPLCMQSIEARQAAVSPELFDAWLRIYRPGVTGAAQLYRSGLEVETAADLRISMELGLEYHYQKASTAEDLRILLASVPASPFRAAYQQFNPEALSDRVQVMLADNLPV